MTAGRLTTALALVCGAVALLTPRESDACRRPVSWPDYSVDVVVGGRVIPVRRYRGRSYVAGSWGDRYAVRITNHTDRRVEVVVSVDGRDVIDGEPANYRTKRGYLLAPYESYDIEGFRTSFHDVAAFRFSDIGDSYAARQGGWANVGVIGAAFFPERRRPIRRPRPLVGRGWEHPSPWSAGTAERAGGKESELRDGAPTSRSAVARGGCRGRCDRGPRQGLGTGWGERVRSDVAEADFRRAHHTRPGRILSLYYDDRAGLAARGVPVTRPWCRDEYVHTRTGRPFATPPYWAPEAR